MIRTGLVFLSVGIGALLVCWPVWRLRSAKYPKPMQWWNAEGLLLWAAVAIIASLVLVHYGWLPQDVTGANQPEH